ncbi:MAG: hypothetical protein GX984_06375 [Erysipelothrix sp.]|nr:hypothetical protein [Erysipelothrix sp.]
MNNVIKNIEGILKIIIAYIIPILSFSISSIALYRTGKVRKTEDRIRDLELYINEYKAKEIEEKQNIQLEAKVEARIINISKGTYKMRIWNSGNLRAFNVSAKIPKEFQIILMANKFPYEYLDPNDSFDENVIIHGSSYRKFKIITEWEDEHGKKYNHEQLRSI